MNFIDQYLKEVENITKFDKLTIFALCPQGNFSESEDILNKVIRDRFRIIAANQMEYISILVGDQKGATVISFSIKEFPKCCGKLILYSIAIPDKVYINYPNDLYESTRKSRKELLTSTLNFVEIVCSRLNYSSFEFILSDVEQPFLVESMEDIGLKPVSIFRNRRNSYKHTCLTFIINLKEVF